MFDTMERPTEPDQEVPIDRVQAALTEGGGHMAAAMCRWLGHLAEFDRRQGWAGWGVPSCAHWLTWQCGVDLASAREQVKVASRLRELPVVRAAFARGELSWFQVRLLARVALPQTERPLVELAGSATVSQLRQVVGGLRRAMAAEEGMGERHRSRSLGWHFDDDGFLVIWGRLAPEDGMVVAKALDALTDDLRRAKR